MISSREAHEYYSMTAVTHGTMWTAAFPEYSSSRMVPFLAATGQYPHNPLGAQFVSSSLAHPDFPGINDRNFRHLWYIWHTFADERDIRLLHDSNCTGIFPVEPEIGHYLMISADRRRALLIVSNFRSESITRKLAIQWGNTGFQPLDCGPYEFQLEPYGITAWLWDGTENVRIVEEPSVHEPAPDPEWRYKVTEQRFRRENPPVWNHITLRIMLPDTGSKPFEDSLVLDLFNNQLELCVKSGDGDWQSIGFVDRNGWCTAESRNVLMPGDVTPDLSLDDRLPAGVNRLKLRSIHGGMPFYSFVRVMLSNGNESYELEFLNDLEPERSELNFLVHYETDRRNP